LNKDCGQKFAVFFYFEDLGLWPVVLLSAFVPAYVATSVALRFPLQCSSRWAVESRLGNTITCNDKINRGIQINKNYNNAFFK